MTPTPRLIQSGPFRFGFITTIGVLLALVLGAAVGNLGYPLTLIFFALFASIGLYPLVLRLERHKFSRSGAVLTVMGGFIVLVGLLLWLIIPLLVQQGQQLISYLPLGLDDVGRQEWFDSLNGSFGGVLTPIISELRTLAADPNVWLTLSGGALKIGAGILNGIVGTVFVLVLTLYFVAAFEPMKQGLYSLVPASRREGFAAIAEEIFESVGKYLGGMFILALMNGAFTFLLLTIVGVPFAAILGALAVPITFIPVVGSVINWVIITFVSLFTSPMAALIVGITMIVYMQVEAYIMTPRIVGKAISIPGSLVLIGAMVGATLLGLLGALIACPVSASILLIIKKVIVPAQNAR
jgi:predicted PurR-regulated permease PerM